MKDPYKPASADDVASLCEKMLEIDLIRKSKPVWFAVQHDDHGLVWPTGAYYFAAPFILGNVVRYEPEMMYRVTSGHSKWTWLLRRFVMAAERFYPTQCSIGSIMPFTSLVDFLHHVIPQTQ